MYKFMPLKSICNALPIFHVCKNENMYKCLIIISYKTIHNFFNIGDHNHFLLFFHIFGAKKSSCTGSGLLKSLKSLFFFGLSFKKYCILIVAYFIKHLWLSAIMAGYLTASISILRMHNSIAIKLTNYTH